ncbi:MAG TPA: putative zinc-binding metallopeptidase, partial [Polyangiaceae bacterium]|nr:putative zinc-binding metallopeptidase [Polyangiaceae bacterium]
MRSFQCECGDRVFFENSRCLTCRRELGFALDVAAIVSLGEPVDGVYTTSAGTFRKCKNYASEGVCNWIKAADRPGELCEACRLNNVIPDISIPENRTLWANVELAKRRLVYTLAQLHLPLLSKEDDPERGLAFDIKSDTGKMRVLTGHADGLITLNLAEADAPTREKARVAMNERYRTLLGHFRHESGHYFWDRLIRERDRFGEFRALFGDETRDYAASLQAHYAADSNKAWSDAYISAYASSHPWEDWAETFAHYLHMIDTLDTAQDFGFTGRLSPRA